MELRLLRYFLAVAHEGNVTRAAEVLHITQPTLSRQIAQLEQELRTTLFERNGKRMELSEDGLLLRRRAEEILELVDKTERDITKDKHELEGVLSVGCGDLAAAACLTQLLYGFSQQHPRVTFDFYTATADHLADRMDRGLTDVALLLEPVDMAAYEFVPLTVQERWVVAMRADDPLTTHATIKPVDLANLPLLLPRRAGIQSVVQNWFDAADVEPHVVATGNLNVTSAVMAIQGFVYPIVVEGALSYWDHDALVCRPLEAAPRVSSVLAWRRNKPFSRVTRSFIDYVRNTAY